MVKKTLFVLSKVLLLNLIFINNGLFAGDVKIIDSRHYSVVFGETRNFRIFLPPGYSENSEKKYPVIYYHHGWGQRFFGSGPDEYASMDSGTDNDGDNVERFVSQNDVIVVKADGYNRRPEEDYYLRPWNIGPAETLRQFPAYFPELVSYIDANYRTIPDREHRAISGLSMGGFMTFWIGGKYPDLICAAGNFCGSPEFTCGPQSYSAELRHMDMYNNFGGVNVRLNYGDQDFIRYYHRDLNKVWTRVMDHYEFGIYPAAHSTCGLGEMFTFIMETFKNPPKKPAQWDHTDVYPDFTVWDYKVASDRNVSGFTILENVDERGFRSSVRKFMPDGEILQFVNLSVTTAPVYEKNTNYIINDLDIQTGKTSNYNLKSDDAGRLKIYLNGSIHEIGINGANDIANIAISSVSINNAPYATLGKDVILKVNLLNKGIATGEGLKAVLTAKGKETGVLKSEVDYGAISMNQSVEPKSGFTFRVKSDSVVIEKFILTVRDKNNNAWVSTFEVPLFRDVPEIKNFEIADGKSVTVAREGIKTETLVLGAGNGDGIANPGESIVLLVKDNGKLYRATLAGNNNYVNPFGISLRESDNWGPYDNVGGSAKYSIPVIASDCPDKQVLNFIAEYWLPDKPNHIIMQGKVNIRVTGNDKTPPQIQWVRIPNDNLVQVKLYDGSKVKTVKVKLFNKDHPEKNFETELKDAGTEGDINPNDNVFSLKVPERKFGLYTVEVTATDSYGNTATYKDPGKFVIH